MLIYRSNITSQPEIDIIISVNETLLDETLLKESNLLTVRLGSAYSLPDSWSLNGPQYNYTVGLPIPATAEVIIFPLQHVVIFTQKQVDCLPFIFMIF